MDDECQSILDACGLTEVDLPALGQPVQPLAPLAQTFKANLPAKAAASQSLFEKALLGQVEGLSIEDGSSKGPKFEGTLENGATTQNGHLADEEDEDEDAAGWDMGDDVNVDVGSDFVNVESVEAGGGSTEADLWARNSPLAADHVAAGSFESAMQLLNRQVGAVNFAPLKPRFLEIYQATKTYLPATAGLPPLVNFVRRTIEETDSRRVLPMIARGLESIATIDLQAGYTLMRQNNLAEGVAVFKKILHSLLVNVVASPQEALEVGSWRFCGMMVLEGFLTAVDRRGGSSPRRRSTRLPCRSN